MPTFFYLQSAVGHHEPQRRNEYIVRHCESPGAQLVVITVFASGAGIHLLTPPLVFEQGQPPSWRSPANGCDPRCGLCLLWTGISVIGTDAERSGQCKLNMRVFVLLQEEAKGTLLFFSLLWGMLLLNGFQADKRFFTLLKKEFSWEEVGVEWSWYCYMDADRGLGYGWSQS